MDTLTPEWSNHLIDDLVHRHYSVRPEALSPALVSALRASLEARTLRPARVGRFPVADASVRNDEICWIDEPLSVAERELFAFFEDLRLLLNRSLYLGLTDFEAHYARYDEGHFYSRHVDRFRDNNARVISVVLYLNDAWTADDGGSLRLFVSPPVDVMPLGGTLVCFTSDDIEHEVLASRRPRASIAAWFRRT